MRSFTSIVVRFVKCGVSCSLDLVCCIVSEDYIYVGSSVSKEYHMVFIVTCLVILENGKVITDALNAEPYNYV